MHAEALACAQDSPGQDSQEIVNTQAAQVSLLSTSSTRLKPLLALPSMPVGGQAAVAALAPSVEQAPLQESSVKKTDRNGKMKEKNCQPKRRSLSRKLHWMKLLLLLAKAKKPGESQSE